MLKLLRLHSGSQKSWLQDFLSRIACFKNWVCKLEHNHCYYWPHCVWGAPKYLHCTLKHPFDHYGFHTLEHVSHNYWSCSLEHLFQHCWVYILTHSSCHYWTWTLEQEHHNYWSCTLEQGSFLYWVKYLQHTCCNYRPSSLECKFCHYWAHVLEQSWFMYELTLWNVPPSLEYEACVTELVSHHFIKEYMMNPLFFHIYNPTVLGPCFRADRPQLLKIHNKTHVLHWCINTAGFINC